jgi:hypothetical protein
MPSGVGTASWKQGLVGEHSVAKKEKEGEALGNMGVLSKGCLCL